MDSILRYRGASILQLVYVVALSPGLAHHRAPRRQTLRPFARASHEYFATDFSVLIAHRTVSNVSPGTSRVRSISSSGACAEGTSATWPRSLMAAPKVVEPVLMTICMRLLIAVASLSRRPEMVPRHHDVDQCLRCSNVGIIHVRDRRINVSVTRTRAADVSGFVPVQQ
jgi:hypothetical protein